MITIKGKHAVLTALETGHNVKNIVMADSAMSHPVVKTILQLASTRRIPVSTLPQREFKKKYPDSNTQSIIATIPDVKHRDIKEISPETHPIIVVLDHLEDPYNFGAIIRTCVGLGIQTIVYPKDRNATITGGVIKASSGAIYGCNLVKVSNIANTVENLSQKGYWIYGQHVHNGQDLNTISPQKPFVLVVGNEQKGISKRIAKMLHLSIKIPMKGPVESFNVSVATGMTLYSLLNS